MRRPNPTLRTRIQTPPLLTRLATILGPLPAFSRLIHERDAGAPIIADPVLELGTLQRDGVVAVCFGLGDGAGRAGAFFGEGGGAAGCCGSGYEWREELAGTEVCSGGCCC